MKWLLILTLTIVSGCNKSKENIIESKITQKEDFVYDSSYIGIGTGTITIKGEFVGTLILECKITNDTSGSTWVTISTTQIPDWTHHDMITKSGRSYFNSNGCFAVRIRAISFTNGEAIIEINEGTKIFQFKKIKEGEK